MTSRVPALIVHGGAGADPADAPGRAARGHRAARSPPGWRVLARGRARARRGRGGGARARGPSALQRRPRLRAHERRAPSRWTPRSWRATSCDCGAVAAVTAVRQSRSRSRGASSRTAATSLLVGDGAARVRARALGVPQCDPAELVTERQRRRLEAATADTQGTVGAVALDRARHHRRRHVDRRHVGQAARAASATAPLIGCGTYADSTLGGVSCTGDGEAIIRVVLARRALDFLKDAGDPDYAARRRRRPARRGRPRRRRAHPRRLARAHRLRAARRRSCRSAGCRRRSASRRCRSERGRASTSRPSRPRARGCAASSTQTPCALLADAVRADRHARASSSSRTSR